MLSGLEREKALLGPFVFRMFSGLGVCMVVDIKSP
jgi:hypothetical protein